MNKLCVGALLLLAAGLHPLLASGPATLPPGVAAQLKRGRHLSRIWVSPAFQPAQGFRVGPVTCVANNLYGGVVKDVPAALAPFARPGSPNVLTLAITGIDAKERTQDSYFAAVVEVEGSVADPAGHLLLAFRDREEYSEARGIEEDCQGAVQAMAAALGRELGLRRAPAAAPKPAPAAPATVAGQPSASQSAPAQGAPASGQAQPAPAPAKPDDDTPVDELFFKHEHHG